MCKFVTTLKTLRKNGACYGGYNKLVRSLQGKRYTREDSFRNSYIPTKHTAEIPLVYILESNGLEDAFWALQFAGVGVDSRMFAVWCASQANPPMADPKSIEAMKVAERFTNGEAFVEELESVVDSANPAWLVARASVVVTAKSAQKEMFIQMCNGTAPWQIKE